MSEPYDLGSNHLQALMLKLAAGLLAFLALILGSCTMHANYLIQQSLEKGADPVAVRCAFSASSDTCSLAAARPQ
jgi:hypothetical protein